MVVSTRADTTDGYTFNILSGDNAFIYADGTVAIGVPKFRLSDEGARVYVKNGSNYWYGVITQVVSAYEVKIGGGTLPSTKTFIDEGYVQPGTPKYTTTGVVTGVTIKWNTIDGGYYAIGLTRATSCLIEDNDFTDQMRNISIQSCSEGNTVYNNRLKEAISVAVHMAFGARNNYVHSNTISATVSHGGDDAGIQDYVHGYGNRIEDNAIEGAFRSDVYIGPGSQSGTVTNNSFDGHNVGINTESGWISGMGGAANQDPDVSRSNTVNYTTGMRNIDGWTVSGNSFSNIVAQDKRAYEVENLWGVKYTNQFYGSWPS